MLKKFFIGALIALSSFGMFSISEAHHGDHSHNSDCYQDGYYCR